MKSLLLIFFLALSPLLVAQGPPDFGDQHPGEGPPPMRPMPGPMDHAMHPGPGRWWSDPHVAQELGLSTDQQHRMDGMFQAHRLRLIDLSASLQKEEAIMEPLLSSDHPEESKILPQIDRIAQARAELEKANARLLLGLRGVLTQEQWKKLEAMRRPEPHPQPQQDGGGMRGPGPGHPGDGPPQPR